MKFTKSFFVTLLVINDATAAGIPHSRVRRSEETNTCEGRDIPCWGSDTCLADAQNTWDHNNNNGRENEDTVQETFKGAAEIVFRAQEHVLELQHVVVDYLYGNDSVKSKTLGTQRSESHRWTNLGNIQVGAACLTHREMTLSATQLLAAYAKSRFIIALERRHTTRSLPTAFIDKLERRVEPDVLELLWYVRKLHYQVRRPDAPLEPLHVDEAVERESQRFCRCVADDNSANRTAFYYDRVCEIRKAVKRALCTLQRCVEGEALSTLQRCVEGEGFLNRMFAMLRNLL